MKREKKKHKGISPKAYRFRTYRDTLGYKGLYRFTAACQETDLLIFADRLLNRQAHELVVATRACIEGFIRQHPQFATRLTPWPSPEVIAPTVVRNMIKAGQLAGVGPMAAVAGAVAEIVGKGLLEQSQQVIVENGGDIFLSTTRSVVAGLFAGRSPLSMKIGLRVPGIPAGIGLCTSSATVGHSLSVGTADAVCVLSLSCALADAAATSIGNQIKTPDDLQRAIDFGKRIEGVKGIVIVAGEKIGAWGEVELVPLKGKKG